MRFPERLALLLCAVGLMVPGPALSEQACGEFPIWSTGDLEFCVDLASFRESLDYNHVQINCSVANDQIRFVEDETGEAHGLLLMTARVENEDGDVIDKAERKVQVQARSMLQAEKRDVIQVVQMDRRLPPGRYRLKVKLTDENAPKVGIWYALRGMKQNGTAEGIFVSTDMNVEQLSISDVTFARRIRSDTAGVDFARSGLEIIPNPSHLYGLRLPELSVYVEMYDGRQGDASDTLMTEYLVVDSRGDRVIGQTRPLAGNGDRWTRAFSIPLVGLTEGSYELAVTVQDPGNLEKATARGCFDVMWSMLSWDRSLQEGLEELSLILDDQELAAVTALSPGDRETYMREYWRRRDPTPDTVQNEALQEYYRRVKFSNEHYSSYEKGMFTDQGRIYIKYGPPDEIRREIPWGGVPSAQDVANPGGGSIISSGDGMAGAGAVDEEGLRRRELGIHESEREMDRLSDSRRTLGKTYEVWVYDHGGRPLSGKWAWEGSGNKIKFVYLDHSGYGNLQLVYSSVDEDY